MSKKSKSVKYYSVPKTLYDFNNTKHLLSIYYVPAIGLISLNGLTILIFTMTLWHRIIISIVIHREIEARDI